MRYDDSEILRVAKISASNLVKTADVYKVVNFYPTSQTVDIEACVIPYQRDMNGEIQKDMFGEYTRMSQKQEPVILLNIPVLQFRCGQFSITAPLAIGDTGVVVFLKNDIENWKVEGGTTGAYHVYPYDINSCVFCPFVPNQANKDANFNANSLEIKSKSVIIRVNESTIDVTATESNITSNINVTGNVSVDGTITATGTVTGSDCLTSGGISLGSHTHLYTDTGATPPYPQQTDPPA